MTITDRAHAAQEPLGAPPSSQDATAAFKVGLSNLEPEAETIHFGQLAWIRLKEGSAWADWIAVGRAHLVGRTEAMRTAHTTTPTGPRYREAFADWLKRFGFHTLDKGDRARLFDVMEHLAEIEKWRGSLTSADRLKLNHPSTVFRRWRRSCWPATEKKLSPIAKLKQQIEDLAEENRRLKRDVETGGGDLWAKTDRPRDIAGQPNSRYTSWSRPRKKCSLSRRSGGRRRPDDGRHHALRSAGRPA